MSSNTNTTQRSRRNRRLGVLGGIAAVFAAVAIAFVGFGGASALLGSTDTGTAAVTYQDHTQTVFTNGTANTLNPTWTLVPGGQDTEALGISNGDVKSKFELKVVPPVSGSVDASQIAGTSISVTDASTGSTVVAQTPVSSVPASGLDLGVLNPGESRTYNVTLHLDASVTVGGGNVTTGLQLVGTQVL